MTAVVLQGVGGILGSMLGGPIGGSIGALAGSLIGNLLDPPKIQGPRLGDTKLQRSTYGTMIPYAWGHGRIGTIVIDQTDLEEHKHTSGGKGGPEITNYTYSASWAAALCARLPNRDAAIAGITHIFADARLIWSQDSGDECPCTVYLGTEDQEPDPTFEGIHGVGNVPGYRGIAYVVFTDFDLTDYGNRIPQIEIVIYTKGGEIPWRVSEFAAWETPQLGNYAHSSGTYSNGVITTVEMGNGGDDDFIIRKWDVQGNQIGTTVSQPCPLPGTGSVFGVLNANIFMRSYRDGGDDEHEVWFYYNESTGQIETGFDNVEASLFPRHVGAPMIAVGDFIFAFGHDAFDWYMGKFQKNGGAGGPLITEVHLYTAVSGWNGAPKFGTSNIDGELYVLHESSDGIHLWKYNTEDMTILEYWPPSSTAGSYLAQSEYIFHVHNGIVCNGHDPSSSFYNIRLTQLGEGSPPTAEPYGGFIFSSTPSPGSSIYLGAGLLLDPAGVYSIIPPAESELLSDVCLDITSLTPTTATVDASELEEDEVRWYVLGQEMTARNALEKLRPPYFFDVVEEDYGINFRKRGDREVVEIDEDDLVPFDGTGDLLRTIRKREQELPRTVTMTYIDVDSDWQTGAQSSPRQVTQSQYDVTLEIPVGFTAIEAAQKCWTIQCAEWNEREAFQFQTTRRWAKVTPTTLVKVRGRIIRVQTVTESPDGKIAYEGVLAAPSIYTQTSTGAPSSGSGTQNPPASKIGTELVLLDIPVISQADAPFGFYAAMGPASDGSWPGATLFKSLDGGVTYEAVASSSSASVIGVTADLATSPPYSGELSAYGGGDVVEEAEIAVILTDDDAELTSCTATALANGANLCAISRGMSGGSPDVLQWEVLQFRDATLIDTDPVTYVIGGFLRGRKGTSTADHAVGDRFVLLPVTNVDAPEQELNVSLKYKAVTYGRAITTATAVDFVNTGVGSEWYYGTESGHLPVYVNEQTGTTYTVDTTDRFRLITFNNASPVAVTLPDGMPDGWNCFIENVGAGTVTLSPAGGALIDNAGTAVTVTPAHGALLVFDGTNYWTMRGLGGIRTLDAGVTVDEVAQAINAVAPLSMASAGSGQTNLTHDDSGVTAATYGSGSSVAQITVDAKGHVTSASSIAISGLTTSTGSFTPGSIIFAGATGALAEDNTNLNFDNANNKIGMGTTSPAVPLHITRASPTDQARVRLAYTNTTTTTGTESGAGLDLFNDSSVQGNFCLHPVKFNNGAAVGKFLPNQIVLNAWALNGLLLTTYDSGAPIVFMTNANGSSSNERMRIAGNGTITLATYPVITAGTAGRIPYATTAGQLTDSASLQFDATNVQVGIGGTPSYHVHAQGSSNAGHEICAHASGSGSGTYAGFRLRTSTQTENFISVAGTGFTTAGFIAAQDMQVAAASGRLNILTIGNQPIRFFTNSTSSYTTTTERMSIDGAGNVVVGRAALATSATDGFLYIPTCAGAPTGTPTTKTGMVPLIFDTTNNNLYIYNGGWKKTTTFA